MSRTVLLRLALPAVLTVQLALTARALWGGFALDDYAWLEFGRRVAASPELLLAPGVAGFFRPVVALDFAVESALWGMAPLPYHATSLGLELIATVVVYALARALGQPVFGALFAAAVFGFNAAHAETAGWISARGSTLATVLGLLTVAVWVRCGHTARGVAAAVALFGAGLLTKEEVLVAWPCIVLLDLARHGSRRVGRVLLGTWPLLAVLIPYLVLQWIWQSSHPLRVSGDFALEPGRLVAHVFARVPELLCNKSSFGPMGAPVVLVVVAAVALRLGWREARAGIGALALAGVALVPTAALSFAGSELRYLHQASAWAAIAAGWWWVVALGAWRSAAGRVLVGLLSVLVVAGGYRLQRRLRAWDHGDLDAAMRTSLAALAPRARAAGPPLRVRDAPLSPERAGPLFRLVLGRAADGLRWGDDRPCIGWTGREFEWIE